MENYVELFFEPIRRSEIDESRYREIETLIKTLDVMSRLNNQSIYIIDYTKQTFLYVSPHPLFLCGYEAEEVKNMGYLFYEKVLSDNDLQMLIEINRMGWKLFYDSPLENRLYSRISYDFNLHHKNGAKILVNHKVSPLLLNEDGNIWVGICIVNYSPHKNVGNVVFTQKNKNLCYSYDFEKKRIISYEPEKLTKRQEEILRLHMQGYNETGICEKLNLSVRTVKNHRYHAEKKLGVNNLANAISKFNLSF